MKRTIVTGSKDFRCPTVGGTVGTVETMSRLWQEPDLHNASTI
jgi:hypothetical protein